MDEDKKDLDLTVDDIRYLTSGSSGVKFIAQLEDILHRCRIEADTVDTSRLPALQGRISLIKSILSLLGVDYVR